jgi:hypothetical protein
MLVERRRLKPLGLPFPHPRYYSAVSAIVYRTTVPVVRRRSIAEVAAAAAPYVYRVARCFEPEAADEDISGRIDYVAGIIEAAIKEYLKSAPSEN